MFSGCIISHESSIDIVLKSILWYMICYVTQGLYRAREAVCDLLLFVLYRVYVEYWKLCVIYYCLCYTGFM